jgi:threonine/homoserine/homoserine lactone efflux protein
VLLAFFLKGIAVGLVIAVPVGPVGVLCVRRTIFDGRLAGLVSGLGAATADAVFGLIAAFGLTFVSDWLLGYEDWLRAIGGCYLVYLGGHSVLGPPPVKPVVPRAAENLLRDFVSTFALTLTNPVTTLAFLGVFAAVGLAGEEATFGRAAVLVGGVWAGSLLWWLGLTLGAGLLFGTAEPRRLSWINRGSGLILLLCGAALLASFAARRLA